MPLPLTGFEQRGHVVPWTTLEEEDQWVTDLLTATSRWSMTVVGQSVDGAPMRLFAIGTGPRKILHIAQQHGPELSGRDAWFTAIREWGESSDPDLLDYLEQVTVLVMPTCHPDDLVERRNSNFVDLNRDHIQLSEPESQAIHSVIRDHDPDVVVDWHEGNNITNDYATSPAFNSNADPVILALSEELSNEVKDAIEGAGNTWELYQGPNNMMRGAENLCNNAALLNRVSVLLETERKYGDETTAGRRHAHQLIAIDAIWRWHHVHTDRIHAATLAADARMDRARELTLNEGTSRTGPLVEAGRYGYLLTAQQAAATELHRDMHGIGGEQRADGYLVPLDQAARALAAYVMDPDSPQQVVAAESAPSPERPLPIDEESIGGYAVKLYGLTQPVDTAVLRLDGSNITVPMPGQGGE